MLETILTIFLYLVGAGIVFWLAVWVLSKLGIEVPQRVIQLVGVFVLLLVILWIVQGTTFNLPR